VAVNAVIVFLEVRRPFEPDLSDAMNKYVREASSKTPSQTGSPENEKQQLKSINDAGS
jgi:hypothetical protein